jgi:hypothetical protein
MNIFESIAINSYRLGITPGSYWNSYLKGEVSQCLERIRSDDAYNHSLQQEVVEVLNRSIYGEAEVQTDDEYSDETVWICLGVGADGANEGADEDSEHEGEEGEYQVISFNLFATEEAARSFASSVFPSDADPVICEIFLPKGYGRLVSAVPS